MIKLQLRYPIISYHTIDVEVSEEKWLEIQNSTDQERAKFIYDRNYELPTPEYVDVLDIQAALDVDYASIKRVKEGEPGYV